MAKKQSPPDFGGESRGLNSAMTSLKIASLLVFAIVNYGELCKQSRGFYLKTLTLVSLYILIFIWSEDVWLVGYFYMVLKRIFCLTIAVIEISRGCVSFKWHHLPAYSAVVLAYAVYLPYTRACIVRDSSIEGISTMDFLGLLSCLISISTIMSRRLTTAAPNMQK